MSRWATRLHDFWFSAAPAERLAMLRILIGGYALYYFWDRYKLFTSPGNPDFFEPVGLAWFLPGPLLQYDLQVLYWLTCLAGLLFVIGWGYAVKVFIKY